MLSFLEFKRLFESNKKKPTFVMVKPDDASMHEIYGLMDRIKLPGGDRVVPSELHATVTYSRTPIDDPRGDIPEFMPISATGDELTVFTSRSGKRCLVLKMSSVSLRALHSHIQKNYGASYDFPTYEPHVTLCYDLAEDFKVPSRIEPINITFKTFTVKPLDLDWTPA